MFYIIQVYTPKTVGIYCTDNIPDKSRLFKTYGKSLRILTGPFSKEDDAMASVPVAMERARKWDVTAPIFYQPPPDFTYVPAMAAQREKEQEASKAANAIAMTGIDF